MGLLFEWDPGKASSNLYKHHVSFEEAATVFKDLLSITVLDPDHSVDEERYITVGMSTHGRLLLVAHPENQEHIRIISARRLTPRERQEYEQGNYRK